LGDLPVAVNAGGDAAQAVVGECGRDVVFGGGDDAVAVFVAEIWLAKSRTPRALAGFTLELLKNGEAVLITS